MYPSVDLFDREAENVLNLEKAGTLLTVLKFVPRPSDIANLPTHKLIFSQFG